MIHDRGRPDSWIVRKIEKFEEIKEIEEIDNERIEKFDNDRIEKRLAELDPSQLLLWPRP